MILWGLWKCTKKLTCRSRLFSGSALINNVDKLSSGFPRAFVYGAVPDFESRTFYEFLTSFLILTHPLCSVYCDLKGFMRLVTLTGDKVSSCVLLLFLFPSQQLSFSLCFGSAASLLSWASLMKQNGYTPPNHGSINFSYISELNGAVEEPSELQSSEQRRSDTRWPEVRKRGCWSWER